MLADCMTSTAEATVSLAPQSVAVAGHRLLSLDALRGLTMFWIVGGAELVLNAAKCVCPQCPTLISTLNTQLDHPEWAGFVAWDYIMPLFLFLVGASLPFAMAKRAASGPTCPRLLSGLDCTCRPARTGLGPTYLRLARRVALLWVLGILLQQIRYEPVVPELFSNTLQAIAVGYLVTSLALLHLSLAGQFGLLAALVLGYGGILMFAPFPGHPGGTLELNANFPLWIDRVVLDVCRRDRGFTWIVTSLGFSATVLLGAMAGKLLRTRLAAARKLLSLVAIGAACAAAGWVWSYWLPWNRHLWTSSMILWAGGVSFIVLALFYAVLDVAEMRWWAFPCLVIGANALLAYALDYVLWPLSRQVMWEAFPYWPSAHVKFVAAVFELGVLWLICWTLYRRRIFLRA
jgi:predicted acyltransferase